MTFKIIRGTRKRPTPTTAPVKLSQAEQRERRRTHQVHQLDGRFDLGSEVRAITEPVATALAAEPGSTGRAARDAVAEIAKAVAEVCAVAGDVVAAGRTAGLDYGERRQAEAAFKAVTHRPAPEISDAELSAGSWAATLTEFAAPLSGPLAAVLGRAARDETRLPVESDRVIEALRAADRAVLSLVRKIDAAREWRASLPTRSSTTDADDHARRLLDALGVEHADLT